MLETAFGMTGEKRLVKESVENGDAVFTGVAGLERNVVKGIDTAEGKDGGEDGKENKRSVLQDVLRQNVPIGSFFHLGSPFLMLILLS